MRRFCLLTVVIVIFAFSPWNTGQVRSVQAQAGSAAELVATVNAVRMSYGLPALQVSPILMGTAQWTADYMASSGICSHIGDVSGRVAAAGFGGGAVVFATENIACGSNLDIATTVYTYWADSAHMIPMVNPAYTHIGGGVAVVDGYVYYVIHAAYSSGAPVSLPSTITTPYATMAPIIPVTTSTLNADGSLIHEVQSGQSLWSIAIAYGVKIADLLLLNNLGDYTTVMVGQMLIVQPSYTPTLSPTVTPTKRPPTRTPTPTATPRTPTATASITPTPTKTPSPLFNWDPPEWLNRRAMGIGILSISAIGLLLLIAAGLRKR